MRYGLSDVRNYDSVEMERSLRWFSALYEPGRRGERTSRREVTWAGVIRSKDRLRMAGAAAIVAALPPPPGAFEHVDRVAGVWVARLPCPPPVRTASGRGRLSFRRDHGELQIDVESPEAEHVCAIETYDPGWHAVVDGRDAAVEPYLGTFLSVAVAAGRHTVTCRYDPFEVRIALMLSAAGLVASFIALILPLQIRSKIQTIGLDDLNRSSYNRIRDLHRTSRPAYH
jgi:membrane protein YfhO